jgi:hypothetical protein
MADATPLRRLAELLLGEPLEDFVRSRRPHKAWRFIARDLYDATNGEIDVTHESLRLWFPDATPSEKASA